jgi:hypothetical protein
MTRSTRSWSRIGVAAGIGALGVGALASVGTAVSPLGTPSAAQQYPPQKVTICHHTHSKKHPSVTINVSQRALPAHRGHGDTLGPCSAGQEVPSAQTTRKAKPVRPAQAVTKARQDTASPGRSGSAPGRSGTAPGRADSAPAGKPAVVTSTPRGNGAASQDTSPRPEAATPPSSNSSPPGHRASPPHGGTPPGQGGTPPGQSTSSPAQNGTAPGQGGTPPGQGGTPPGQGKKE